jgi:spore coat polysaccharide biosynthesis protein SpsF
MNEKQFGTDQENFWAGDFGTEYIERNRGDQLLASNLDFFVKALRNTRDIASCIEFGANIGMNIKAIKLLYPQIEAAAIELNTEAGRQLGELIGPENVYNQSILDYSPDRSYDLTLIKGVLIHLNPDVVTDVYDKLVATCGRFLLVAEYYNPSPVTIPYHGHLDRLFKRDFAGEIMDRHPIMELIDYGFAYRRDPSFPQDDITWFLMEKKNISL